MSKIYVGDGNSFVWQWQPKEQIVLEGYPEGVFVHYANCDTVEAPVVQSRMEGDKLVADIPPELMQVDKDITVYVCDVDGTKRCHFLSVLSRPKPESYVTEPVEVLRYESLAAKIPFDDSYNGKLLYVVDGVARPLAPGDGVEVVQQEDGTLVLVAHGGSGGGIVEEKDPTVAEWAKVGQPRPVITVNGKAGTVELDAEDVGAQPRRAAMVSFVDDDCRAAAHSVLFPLVQELGVPLTVACAPGELGATIGAYMSTGQLQEMHRAGVEVSCHHWKQDNMDTFATAEDYAADLDRCLERFAELGIQAETVAYPQGIYTDNYMHVVRERFRAGLGVFRGINEPPLESYFLRRCELFPTNGAFTLADAKALVDDVAREGGWLIFMTHAWYPTFDPAAFRELVEYVRGKNVEIVGTSEALDRMGNAVEVGLFRKPVEDLTEPYFVTDCEGRTASGGWEAVALGLRSKKVISATGPVVSESDPEYYVSEQADVTGQETVLVSAWASDGLGLYAFYDANGNRKAVRYSTKSWAEGGEMLLNEEVRVPEGAAKIAIAGYFRQQMPGLKIVRTGGVGEPGKDGEDGITPHIGANGNWWLGEEDTGEPSRGAPGKDGYTPVKGVDYFTPDEVQEIAEQAAALVPGGGGGGAAWEIVAESGSFADVTLIELDCDFSKYREFGIVLDLRASKDQSHVCACVVKDGKYAAITAGITVRQMGPRPGWIYINTEVPFVFYANAVDWNASPKNVSSSVGAKSQIYGLAETKIVIMAVDSGNGTNVPSTENTISGNVTIKGVRK